MIIILTLLWILFATIVGISEGYFFNSTIVDKKVGLMLHSLWTVERTIVLVNIALLNFDWWLIGLPLLFSFFHDGTYYLTRNLLDNRVYRDRWFAQSTTSTAITTKFFIPIVRTTLAIIGLLVIIIYYIIHYG